jgi:hypothetical protein
MSYYAYTVLECTNPELISSGSTYVKESHYSKLLKVEKGKSHFLTIRKTMHGEIFDLSIKHPEETFTGEWEWDEDYWDRILYRFECKNGEFKNLGIKPGYMFFCHENQIYSKEDYSAFRDHVIRYLERLDIVKEQQDGKYVIDKLNNEKDQNGYESYITITYENDLYKWTATKKWISWIEVTCEKKEPKVDPLKELENKMKCNDNEEYDDLPF